MIWGEESIAYGKDDKRLGTGAEMTCIPPLSRSRDPSPPTSYVSTRGQQNLTDTPITISKVRYINTTAGIPEMTSKLPQTLLPSTSLPFLQSKAQLHHAPLPPPLPPPIPYYNYHPNSSHLLLRRRMRLLEPHPRSPRQTRRRNL